MNTKINLTYKGESYTLEYNRIAVKVIENSGFILEEFLVKPMINIELAFSGAFVKNHSKISQTTIDEIYANMKDKKKLISVLQTMITECYDSLLADPTDIESEGNVMWEIADLSPKKSQK